MLVTKYSSLTATDGALPHSATWTITHSWQKHGWLIRLSNSREHKTAIYFIINFMLELVFFPFNKSLNPWLSIGNLWKTDTFDDQRSRAAGCSKMIPGYTCVPSSIGFGDVGDTESPVIHDGLPEMRYRAETATHKQLLLINCLLLKSPTAWDVIKVKVNSTTCEVYKDN